jgi:predicted nucleic acid-binding Zn ribbon protein
MSRAAPRMLATALEDLTSILAPATPLARVQQVWTTAAGSAIAERAGVLTVSCAAAVWAQELDLMADDLIARVNAALGEEAITELRCRTG